MSENRFARLADDLLDFEISLIESSEQERSYHVVEAQRDELKGLWDKVKTAYDTVMDDDLCENKVDIRERFKQCQEGYISAVALLSELCSTTLNRNLSGVAPNVGVIQSSTINTEQQAIDASHPPLPACDLAPFYGDYQSWPSFRDMFTALYINSPRVSNVQRRYYLSQKCRGEALDIVRTSPLTSDGFQKAWAKLEKKYENRRTLVNSELKTLMNLKLISEESSAALKQLQNEVNNCRDSLELQKINVEAWDFFFVYLCSTKLPETSLSLWEQSLKNKTELPMWDPFDSFLTERIQTLDMMGEMRPTSTKTPTTKAQTDYGTPKCNKVRTYHTNLGRFKCHLCSSTKHVLNRCPQFLALNDQERFSNVERLGLCTNCFAQSHKIDSCKSTYVCVKCKGRHHTLLHSDEKLRNPFAPKESIREEQPQATTSRAAKHLENEYNVSTYFCENRRNVLLGTAQVIVVSGAVRLEVRALIDSGSEATFITQRLQKLLKMPTKNICAKITGLNSMVSGRAMKSAQFTLCSPRDSSFERKVSGLILPNLTGNLPSHPLTSAAGDHNFGFPLADENWMQSRSVDVLIGGDIYPEILLEGLKKKVMGSLIAQQTVFGWILTGPLEPVDRFKSNKVISLFNEVDLNRTLCKFWEVEEPSITQFSSDDDKSCEEIYEKTTRRLEDGRYQVQLPFKPDANLILLNDSKRKARCLLLRNELRLSKDPALKEEYSRVLDEYITLGHMQEAKDLEGSYYLPHHAVLKPESTSTKVRVVFNASSRTKGGCSLNDLLFTGPVLQADLMQLILKWRTYQFVFNGDIEKMYRQILVAPHHTRFQRILYRPTQGEPIKEYELQTVTFGVNCAPYLAIKTLHRIAKDNEKSFPLASEILTSMMYVDDALVGAHDLDIALKAREELTTVLKSAGLVMRKWTANNVKLLEGIPSTDVLSEGFLKLDDDSSTKTLGIRWNAKTDSFFFLTKEFEVKGSYTKREILSIIASLFDPAGWLAPIIIRAKIFMQKLWLKKVEWDALVPQDIFSEWRAFLGDQKHIDSIRIDRWIRYSPNVDVQYHAYCDASEKAYAACIYIRVSTGDTVSTQLLCAKTRVAPVKSISLPRLELCGAKLLADLVHSLTNIPIPTEALYCWTDSTIVLAWLQKSPCLWNTFVANRVAKIQEILKQTKWLHVESADNPADLGSRGATARELVGNSLWWNGPHWLKGRDYWSTTQNTEIVETTLEQKGIKVHMNICPEEEDELNRFSSYSHGIKVMSYAFKFIDKLKHRRIVNSIEVTKAEFESVQERLVRITQQRYFTKEYECLKNKKLISSRSSILTLNPFMDANGIIRVGSRLANAPSLSYGEKYPIILPYQARLAKLLIDHIHKITIHGGEKLMLRLSRTKFWIVRVRNIIRGTIRSCKPCILFKKATQTQIMSALPEKRLTWSRPFNTVGVDFCGPFDIKSYAGRGCKMTKGYVCIFVCFATKAVHLEGTSELSTETFLAAFNRSVARRGCPKTIFSDNGTNFVGASRILKREFKNFLHTSKEKLESLNIFQNLEWRFIPPGAPHMGGLWEAAVKSFKHHFKRVAGLNKFTFEEFSTLIYRIEACLNSRPISAQSNNPEDITALTPGHFLIGGPLLTECEAEIKTPHESIHNRWQKLKAMSQELCRRWKQEYLNELHKRYKWKKPKENLKINDLVAIKEDNLLPNEWRMGRIVEAPLGKDGYVRVVTIRTSRGLVTRPITKLVMIPLQ